jgi:primosomal protein N' (replication factor Y)
METELRKLFFDKKVIRLDSDLSGVDEREAELLVASGSPVLIVGTQKIGTTRFANLPKLALIFGFDFMVNYPDFRCREKAVRTLASLADRIEPLDDQESILIETSMEELPFYKNLQDFNLKNILDMELEERKVHSFPPYVEQLCLALDSTKQDALSEAEGQLEAMLNKLSQRFNDISFYKLQPVSMKARSGYQSRSFILSAPDIFKRSAEICKFLNSFQKTVGRDVKLSINTDPSAFI